MAIGSTLYNILLLCHLLCVIVGFGSSFVYPVLASRARGLEPKESYAINHAGFSISKFLTTYPIIAAGVFGVALIGVSGENGWKFSDKWVSIAFFLFILALLVAFLLHTPNLKAMDALGAKLAVGDVTPSKEGPPKEVVEMQARASRAGMYGGILHLFFLLLMLDMIFKPGR